jgi:membrane fusion protein (multidrug efflux system)
MTRKIFLLLSLPILFFGCKKPVATTAPPQVDVLTVTAQDVPIYQQWIGTLDGYPNAQIRAQVTGYLVKQDYAEGSAVKTGDLLFEIDPRPFQAVLDQAKARLAQDQANLGKTELDVKRYTPLAKEQAISQEQLDNAVQANLAARAAIVADEATIESATLNLGFCRITSPVDGIAGLAQAQIGDLVAPGGSVLTVVSALEPIRAYFNISEESYLQLSRRYTNAAEFATHADEMQLQLILSDGSVYPKTGKWIFTDRQINSTTGTIQAAATFPNPNNVLRPGQYGRVRAKIETRRNVILVPQRAVTELQGAYQVAVVDNENKAHIRSVRVGDPIGKQWLIESGLAPNEKIIIEGTQKAREGAVVNPQPYKEAAARE